MRLIASCALHVSSCRLCRSWWPASLRTQSPTPSLPSTLHHSASGASQCYAEPTPFRTERSGSLLVSLSVHRPFALVRVLKVLLYVTLRSLSFCCCCAGLSPWVLRSTTGAIVLGASAVVGIILIHPVFWVARAVMQRLPARDGTPVWQTMGLKYALPAAVLAFGMRYVMRGGAIPLQPLEPQPPSAAPRVYDFTVDELSKFNQFKPLWASFTAVAQRPVPLSLARWSAHNNSENHYFAQAATESQTLLLQFACWLRETKARAAWTFDQAFRIGPNSGVWWPYGGLMLRISRINGFHAKVADPEENALRNAATRFLSELSGYKTDSPTPPFSFQGLFYYPPHGVREWHTNADKPGWRMYLVSVAEPGRSQFSHSTNGKVSVIQEQSATIRLFKIPHRNETVFPHSIVSWTDRFSFGVNLFDERIVWSLLCSRNDYVIEGKCDTMLRLLKS